MKDLRSKKAIAASLSLTLALGSVPAVALADDADENSEGATSEQSTQAELSFSANGGQFTDGSTGVTIKANEDGSINAPTPTRAGFTFKGWYSQSDMDGIPENYQQYYKLDPSSAKAGSWFAAWEKNAEVQAQSVEVVSFFQGGERDGSSVTTTIDVTADSSVADCVKSFEGYTPTKVVSGVATSEQEVNMTSSLEGISTLYVYYKADEQKTEQNQINVLYAANGGQFVDGNETMQGVADSDGKLRQPPTPTRDGYTFAGCGTGTLTTPATPTSRRLPTRSISTRRLLVRPLRCSLSGLRMKYRTRPTFCMLPMAASSLTVKKFSRASPTPTA